MSKRIMFAGPSGFGKTTLAKWVEETMEIPFISGSVSDLLPKTKEMPHQDMLARDPNELYREDFQIVNLRNRIFKDKDTFVSDRSYLDSAAYFLYKQADKQPACEVEHFLDLCQMLLVQQCDYLIVLDFTPKLLHVWNTEDNNKRITSNYFQIEISSIMMTCLGLMGTLNLEHVDRINMSEKFFKCPIGPVFTKKLIRGGYSRGSLVNRYGFVRVVIIREPDLLIRQNILGRVIL